VPVFQRTVEAGDLNVVGDCTTWSRSLELWVGTLSTEHDLLMSALEEYADWERSEMLDMLDTIENAAVLLSQMDAYSCGVGEHSMLRDSYIRMLAILQNRLNGEADPDPGVGALATAVAQIRIDALVADLVSVTATSVSPR
jgi:hypothetical protein